MSKERRRTRVSSTIDKLPDDLKMELEEYVQRGENFPQLRAQLLKDFRAGAELTGPGGLRRKLGAIDLGYFGRAYLPHYFLRPSPPFHEELDRIFRDGVMKGMNPETDAKKISRADGCRRAVEAPRGHAKSTNFTFKDSIHSAVYAYKHYEIKIIDDALDASRRLKRDYKKPLYRFGIETVQFQYYFAEVMAQKSAECGEYLPIEEINSVGNKDARIQSLQPFVKNGYGGCYGCGGCQPRRYGGCCGV